MKKFIITPSSKMTFMPDTHTRNLSLKTDNNSYNRTIADLNSKGIVVTVNRHQKPKAPLIAQQLKN